jgi:alanine dehydrogenase
VGRGARPERPARFFRAAPRALGDHHRPEELESHDCRRSEGDQSERADLKTMKPGAVIVDVAVDQGGCVETARPTTHGDPTYIVDDIVHYCVANMPGAVGRTSTYALCNVTLPYAQKLANHGLGGAVERDPTIETAVNVHAGRITNSAVAATFGFECARFSG